LKSDIMKPSKLVGLSSVVFVVSPVFKFNNAITSYITQSSPPNLSTFYFWAVKWVTNMFKPNGRLFSGRKQKNVAGVPNFLTPISKAYETSRLRAESGLKHTTSRSDENGLTVNSDGRFIFVPDSDNVNNAAALEFEKLFQQLIEISSELGAPLNLDRSTIDDSDEANAELEEALKDIKTKIKALTSSPLLVDWNTNAVVSISPSLAGDLVKVDGLEGSSKPRKLAVPGALLSSVDMATHLFLKHRVSADDFHDKQSMEMDGIAKTYAFLRKNNKIRDIQYYLRTAAKKLGKSKGIEDSDFEAEVMKYFMNLPFDVVSKDGLNFITWSKFNGTNDESDNEQKLIGEVKQIGSQSSDY
jgi:hypothetical protein